MVSPFSLYANMTAVFEVPTTPQTVETAGITPEVSTTPQICIAWVNRAKKRVEDNEALRDGELSQLHYSGFWVLPMRAYKLQAETIGKGYIWRAEQGIWRIPEAGWTTLAEYEAFIETESDRIEAVGDFVLAPSPASQWGVQAQTGWPIEGYLLTQVAWADQY